jgi:hypothetical protein
MCKWDTHIVNLSLIIAIVGVMHQYLLFSYVKSFSQTKLFQFFSHFLRVLFELHKTFQNYHSWYYSFRPLIHSFSENYSRTKKASTHTEVLTEALQVLLFVHIAPYSWYSLCCSLLRENKKSIFIFWYGIGLWNIALPQNVENRLAMCIWTIQSMDEPKQKDVWSLETWNYNVASATLCD